jgi:Holliday junction resolvase
VWYVVMVSSVEKGKAGERELAQFLEDRGFPARRGVQYSGGPDSPDIVVEGLADIHFECKRVERGALEAWMAQAKRDCGTRIPVVAHRKNRGEWVAILPLKDLLSILKQRTEW